MNMTLSHHVDLLYRFERGLMLKEAIFAAVRPGDRVLDAGCGTGLLSIWAAQAGASEVLGVDLADLSVAKALAEENGVGDRVTFSRENLADLTADRVGRFDVIIAMVYFNDPRRDEAQSQIAFTVRQKLLAEGGRMLPDRVHYEAFAVDWPEQELATKIHELERKLRIIRGRYGLSFTSLEQATSQTLDARWYPLRGTHGVLQRERARPLSRTVTFTEVAYAGGGPNYPEQLQLPIVASGTVHGIVFTQNLMAGERLIFSNEALSWVHPAVECKVGTTLQCAIDTDWRSGNRISAQTLQ